MIKEYLFKILKEQRISVTAENEMDAYNKAEEESLIHPEEADIIDVDLIDVCEEDVDELYDNYRLNTLDDEEIIEDNDEGEIRYDKNGINKYFYKC